MRPKIIPRGLTCYTAHIKRLSLFKDADNSTDRALIYYLYNHIIIYITFLKGERVA